MQQTSLMAYNELDIDNIRSMYKAIISSIRKEGSMTDQEITRKLGFDDPNKIRPRRNELVKMGYIIPVGKRVCKFTRKNAISWHLTKNHIN